MNKSIEEILAPKPDARPRIYAYSIADKAHAGLLKVGQTTRDVKRRVAEQLATRPEVVQSAFAGNEQFANESASDSGEKNDAALPQLLTHGGVYRGLAVLPQQASGVNRVVAAELGPDASILTGVGSDIVLCQEAWDLPLVPTAVDLIQGRRDYAEFAARVVTRSDVPWTPLTAPPVAMFPTFGDNAFSESAPVMTQVL